MTAIGLRMPRSLHEAARRLAGAGRHFDEPASHIGSGGKDCHLGDI